MNGNCVISYAERAMLQERHPGESVCNHCVYHQYGCPNQPTFKVEYRRYVAIEQSPDELPKAGIWCKHCKDNSGRIFHKTLWNGRTAYAVRCKRCGSEFLLYESRVRQQYTGFVNGNGDFVHPDRYLTGRPRVTPGVAAPDPILAEIRRMLEELESSMPAEDRRIMREEKERRRRERFEHVVVYSTTEENEQPTAMELAMRKAMEKKNAK